jgi:NAD-dependent deacetylase
LAGNQELSIDAACEQFQSAERILLLTGAGVSVASGLPVYRGAQGSVYDDPDQLRDAMASSLFKDPERYWLRHAQRRQACSAVEPNEAHHALVKLEALVGERGGQLLLASQNIDNLHRRAGQRELVELHGNVFYLRCMDFDCPFTARDETDPQLAPSLKAPVCSLCGAFMRPDLVLFGEGDDSRWEPIRSFVKAGVDLIVLIGASGVVTVPAILLQAAQQAGQRPYVMEINPNPSQPQELADKVSGHLQMKAEEALPAIINSIIELL